MKSIFGKGLVFVSACILFTSTPAHSQEKSEGPVGIFSSRQEYNQFMGSVKQSAYGPNGTAEMQAMIPMLNDIALNQPIGSTAKQFKTSERSTLDLLSDANIRKELEMVDSQYNELKELNEAIELRMSRQVRELDFSDTSKLVERLRKMRDDAQKDLNVLLLPHQLQRLRQIMMQSQLRRRSLVDILTSDPMKSEFQITEEQTADLKRAEKEIEKELAEEIARLQSRARDKLLSRLKPGQAASIKEQIGDAFEFQAVDDEKKDRKPQLKKGL